MCNHRTLWFICDSRNYQYPYPCTDLMLAAVLNMFYKKAKHGMQGD